MGQITDCYPQRWLRSGKKLQELEDKFHIKVKRHSEFPNLVMLKYDQIESPMAEPLVRQCRGLILDEANNWNIVARPFDKFFNAGEQLADNIDWHTANVYEKLDGSLMILYWHNERWHVATSGTPDASGEVLGTGITFRNLFWSVWEKLGYSLPNSFNTSLTFMFELTTPFNRVVVWHAESKIRLIGVRNRFTGIELPIESFVYWERVPKFPRCKDLLELVINFNSMSPVKQEGYVVVDASYHRVKVKHPGYVALHHMRDNITPKGILEVVKAGEVSEVVTHFPEWAEVFAKVSARYEALAMQITQDWDNLGTLASLTKKEPGKASRKAFAIEAGKCKIPGAMFSMLDDKVKTAKEYLNNMHIEQLMYVLNVRDITANVSLPNQMEVVNG